MSSTQLQPRHIVIVGGGIIGCTTAYYLSHHSKSTNSIITLLEASVHGPAQGASGKAGGLIATWAYPSELSKISFSEHMALAGRHNGVKRWGWRFVSAGEWAGHARVQSSIRRDGIAGEAHSLEKKAGLPVGVPPETTKMREAKGLPADLTWVNEELTELYSPLAPDGETAQVHPRLFTKSMLDLAQERGVRFVRGRVTTIVQNSGRVMAVRYIPADAGADAIEQISADCVILAAGAWSPTLLQGLPISGTRAHSIVVRPPVGQPPDAVAPYVLFTAISLSDGSTATPEVYARPGGELYVCGPGDTRAPLPTTVDDVQVEEGACDDLWEYIARTGVLQPWALGEVEAKQACYLPIVQSRKGGGGPIVGAVSDVKGLIVAVGHTCWGICNAPGTARAVSELVFEGEINCADLRKLSPGKFL